MKTIVACDPGVNGGFAIKTPDGIILLPMPESVPDMAQLISGFKVAESHFWIEKLPKFVSSLTPAATMATLHENYGICQGLAYAYGYAEPRCNAKELRCVAHSSLRIGRRSLTNDNRMRHFSYCRT